VQFHFTPIGASWLSQVEVWFSILHGQSLSGTSFTSLEHLQEHIDAYINAYNDRDAAGARLDQEKGPSTQIQRPPYHSTLIPDPRLCICFRDGRYGSAQQSQAHRCVSNRVVPDLLKRRIEQAVEGYPRHEQPQYVRRGIIVRWWR
jgi:hypothetical protein